MPREKKTTTSFPELFRLSGENPEEVEVQQYSCLDVTSILFIDTCLPSLSKSWLSGPVKWLTEETTNRFKSNAGSYLRVKNRSIVREKNEAFRAEERTNKLISHKCRGQNRTQATLMESDCPHHCANPQ